MTVTLNKVLPNLKLTTRNSAHMAATLPDMRVSAQTGVNLWQDPLDIDAHFLPALKLDVQMGGHASLAEKLPVLEGAGYGGAAIDAALNLPELRVSAGVTGGAVCSLSKKLPVLTAEGYTAAKLSGNLPALQLETGASFGRDSLLSLNKTLPGLTISAGCYGGGGATLDKSLPAIEFSGGFSSASGTADLAVALPGLKGSATISTGSGATFSKYLPDLSLTATASGVVTGSLDEDLPALFIIAAQVSGQARFDNYILRHSRW